MSGDVGSRLRRAREARGWSLRDAAQRTKLSIDILQSIESNHFDNLPGGMYRKAYVRTFAAEVGLDGDALAAEYCAAFEPEIEPPAEPQPVHAQEHVQEQWIEQLTPSPRRSLLSLAALAAPAAIWFMLQAGREAPGALPVMPADTAAGIAETIPEAGPIPVAAKEPAAGVSVELQARSACWISAEADGERVLYRLVEAGERLMLSAERMIRLRLGDAGAVTLSINEGPSRSFGEPAEVIDLEFSAETFDRSSDSAAVSPSSS